jgi:hypothetical protein
MVANFNIGLPPASLPSPARVAALPASLSARSAFSQDRIDENSWDLVPA